MISSTQLVALAFALLLVACQGGERQLVPKEEASDFGSSLSVQGEEAVVGSRGALHFFARESGQWKAGAMVRLGDPEFAYVSAVPTVKFCGEGRVTFSHPSMAGTLVRNGGSWELEQQLPVGLEIFCNEDILIYGNQAYFKGEQVQSTPGSPRYLTEDGRLVSTLDGLRFYVLRDGLWSSLGRIPDVFPTHVTVEDALVVVVSSGSLQTFKQVGNQWVDESEENPESWSRPTLAKGLLVGEVQSETQEFVIALRREGRAWVPAEGENRVLLATDPDTPQFGAMAFDGETLLLQAYDWQGTPRVEAYDLR